MKYNNKKYIYILLAIVSVALIATVVFVIINFKSMGLKSEAMRAKSIALAIEDGLTTQMINDTMDNSYIFLDNLIKHQNIQNIATFRSKKVIEQFESQNGQTVKR